MSSLGGHLHCIKSNSTIFLALPSKSTACISLYMGVTLLTEPSDNEGHRRFQTSNSKAVKCTFCKSLQTTCARFLSQDGRLKSKIKIALTFPVMSPRFNKSGPTYCIWCYNVHCPLTPELLHTINGF